jgi:hypothetical protein
MRSFLAFWYDFVIGDDWVVAAGVVVALGLTALLAHAGLNAWWLLPASVAVLLVTSLVRVSRAATARDRDPSPPAP